MIGFHPELADEYVLGLLEPDEERRLEHLAETNEGVARAIARARDRYLELDLQTVPEMVPDGYSDRVLLSLETPSSEPESMKSAPEEGIVSSSSPLPQIHGWARSGWFVPAVAAVLALCIGLGIGWQFTLSDPRVIAVVMDGRGAPRAMVEDFGNDTARLRFLSSVDVPDDRVMQVWTLPSPELGPKSMGLLPAVRPRLLEDFQLPVPHDHQLYEITLEPEGGSPTGRPTGPILAKGYGALQPR